MKIESPYSEANSQNIYNSSTELLKDLNWKRDDSNRWSTEFSLKYVLPFGIAN